MNLVHFATALLACFFVSVQVASAAGGGNMGGPAAGRGGGAGPDLNELFRRGTELLADGECKQAEKKFRRVLKAVSKNPEANYLRGAALQCQGKHQSAARYLKRAKRYDKQLYAAYQKLGVSYLALGRRDDAQSQLEELTELLRSCGEECPDALSTARSKLDTAIRSSLDPEGTSPAETDSGSSGEYGLLFDSVADSQIVYLEAVQLIHSARFTEAILELRRLTGAIGPHPDVLNYLGYASRRLGLFESAQGYYEQALKIDPMHRGANEYLGEMWVELGRIDRARTCLERLDRACPFGCAEYEDLNRRIGSRLAAAH